MQEQDQQPAQPQSESMPSPQQESHHSESPRQDQPRAPSNISGFMNQESPSPPPLQHQSPQAPRSIWGEHQKSANQVEQVKNTNAGLGVWGSEETARESPNSFYNQVRILLTIIFFLEKFRETLFTFKLHSAELLSF